MISLTGRRLALIGVADVRPRGGAFCGILDAMGFLRRRREKKWLRSVSSMGEEANESLDMDIRLNEQPLTDPTAQELRVALEAKLDAEWKMPEVWAGLGVAYTNARGDGADEHEAYAFTDALVFGYALREVEASRPDARPIPVEVASSLRDAPDRAEDVLQAVLNLVATDFDGVRLLTDEAWSDFDYWAGQFIRHRSRGRKRERGGYAVPAQVDYEHALLFGYALRCCSEVRGDGALGGEAIPAR